MVSDKDRSTIINMLPKDAEYFVVKPSVIRGLDASILAKDMKAIGLNAHGYSEFKLAVDAVIHSSDYLESVVFIGGSTFLVADAMVHYS
jgi:dihydrofolate synthase/folylpolyglutamate synthase